MELKNILLDSLRTALELPNSILRYIILVILSLIPLVNLTVLGYAYRYIEEEGFPELRGFGKMFIKGFKIAMVLTSYLFLPIFILFVLMIKAGIYVESHLELTLLTYSVSFLLAIPMFIGIILMIVHDDYVKAFDLIKIFKILRGVYIEYLIWLAITFLAGLLILTIYGVEKIGWIFGSAIFPFYVIFVLRSSYLMYQYGENVSKS
jgi:hypothetical protein